MFSSKLIIRCFILSLMALIAIDAWPAHDWCVRIKWPVAQVTDWLGLRQGSWEMFAPNPALANRWISVNKITKDGRTLTSDTHLWSEASIWDKFVRFRHMNYGNRVHQPWCLAGAKDYRDYLIRTSDEPLDSIQLYLNRLVIVMPEDGSLPPREETEWRLISEPWIGESVTP